jgi:hypothetical protein
MPNTEGSTGQPICVLFGDAIAWIAVRNFTGAVAIGPRPFGLLPCGDGDDDEEYRTAEGRSILAQELLIDRAAKGRIRIYAGHGWADDQEVEEAMSFPLQLSSDFLTGALHEFDYGEGHVLFIPEERGYNDLAVDYSDLIREFWGDAAAPSMAIRETIARPSPSTVLPIDEARGVAPVPSARAIGTALRPLRPRGRRPRYPWPDFAAELARRSLSGPPMVNQAALERHMLATLGL